MRHFIRHPADIPISYDFVGNDESKTEYLRNISQGGICFQAHSYLKPGQLIHIYIQVLDPSFETTGIVAWCKKNQDSYEAGVKFENSDSEYSVRMVEQICHIEHYRNKVLETEGRELTGEEAAVEWITKHAADFPR